MDEFENEKKLPEENAEVPSPGEEIDIQKPESNDELLEELSEIRDMFQKELDKAKEGISDEELIQELEEEEQSAEEKETEEIDEALLCECCGANLRSTEYGEDYPYCDSCREAMKRYPLRASGFITLLLGIALFVTTAYFSLSYVEVAPTAIDTLSYFSEGKTLSGLYSAYNYLNSGDKDTVSKKILKKSITGFVNTGYFSDATDLIENYFSETALKMPWNKKYKAILDDNEILSNTYYKVTEIIEPATEGEDYDYEKLQKALSELSENEEYNPIFVEYYKFILMGIHKESLEDQLAQLKKVDEIGQDYKWIYLSNLCAIAAKVSDYDTVEYAYENMITLNKEDPYIYLAKASYYRYLDKPDTEKMLEVCSIAKENSYGGDLSYKTYEAISYLLDGKTKEALEAIEEYVNSEYTVQNCALYALCGLAANDEEIYNEMKSILENNGYKLSPLVEKYKNGKLTLEEVLKDKGGDL